MKRKVEDLSGKYHEISMERLYLFLCILGFLFTIGMLIFIYICDFSRFYDNTGTIASLIFSFFMLYKTIQNKKYLRYFFRLDLCLTTIEVIMFIVGILLIITLFTGDAFFLGMSGKIKSYKQTVDIERIMLNEERTLSAVRYVKPDTYDEFKYADDLYSNLCEVRKSYYFEFPDLPALKFSRKEIDKYRLKQYVNTPTVKCSDGMIYSLIKYEKGCKEVNTKAPLRSSCVLEVDINGFTAPNGYDNDRLLHVIHGNRTIPADITVKTIKKRIKYKESAKKEKLKEEEIQSEEEKEYEWE